MNEELMIKTAELHNKVRELKVYDFQEAGKLFDFSREFIPLLDQLMKYDNEKFHHIHTSFYRHTEKLCRQAFEYEKEEDRNDAFYEGVIHLNNNINDTIENLND